MIPIFQMSLRPAVRKVGMQLQAIKEQQRYKQ